MKALKYLILFFPTVVFASFDFNPIIATLAPSGEASTVAFQVTNQDKVKIPVQITIYPRVPDVEGKEDYTDKAAEKIEDQFRVFPNQLILEPNETRTIRVSWKGNQKLTTELPFRIIAEEIPVDVSDPNKKYDKAVAHITISTRYIGSLYVTPNGVKPNLIVEVKNSETANKGLELELINKGTAHQVVKNPVLKLKSIGTGKEITCAADEIKDLMNQNIMPGMTRKFHLIWPKELPVGQVKATLEFAKE